MRAPGRGARLSIQLQSHSKVCRERGGGVTVFMRPHCRLHTPMRRPSGEQMQLQIQSLSSALSSLFSLYFILFFGERKQTHDTGTL